MSKWGVTDHALPTTAVTALPAFLALPCNNFSFHFYFSTSRTTGNNGGGGNGGKVHFPRFQKGLEKETKISLLPVTEGGGFHAFPLPVSQMPRSVRLSNLQTRLPGHRRTRNPVPLLHCSSWELWRRGTAGLLIRSSAPESADSHLCPPLTRSPDPAADRCLSNPSWGKAARVQLQASCCGTAGLKEKGNAEVRRTLASVGVTRLHTNPTR